MVGDGVRSVRSMGLDQGKGQADAVLGYDGCGTGEGEGGEEEEQERSLEGPRGPIEALGEERVHWEAFREEEQ